jgi:hypothetical protein
MEKSELPYPKPQLPISFSEVMKVQRLPVGFQVLAVDGKLRSSTVDLILSIILEMDKGPPRNEPWTGPTSIGTFPEFSETIPALRLPDDEQGPALERLMCLALARCRRDLRIGLRTPACLSHSITLDLASKVPLRTVPEDVAERECLLWVWLMLLDSRPITSPETGTWLRRMSRAFPEVSDWEVEDFEAFGESFIWTDYMSLAMRTWWKAPR